MTPTPMGFTAVLNDYHGSVFKVSYCLVLILSFLNQADFHFFTGKNNRLERVCKQVDVENMNTVKFSNFIEIEIICHNFRIHDFCQFNKFRVYFRNIRKIHIRNFYFYRLIFLHFIENIKTASASVSFY